MTVGTVIADRFELIARAAQGGMGSVYRARDRAAGTMVAVKVLSLTGTHDRIRFDREAKLLALLDHDRVVRYVMHGVTPDQQHYLVQEWIEGTTLRALLRSTGTTVRDAVTIARGLLEALIAAHALAIVHRDIKPDNIILANGAPDAVKLVDFGIARQTFPSAKLTRTGTVVGTPAYMAPEQARGSTEIGSPADVWAVGCVIYEMLAGRQPFKGRSAVAQMLFAPPPPLAASCPEADPELVSLIERMLTRDPERRPALSDALALLERIRVVSGPRRSTGAPHPKTLVKTPTPVPVGDVTSLLFVNRLGDNKAHELAELAERYRLELHDVPNGAILVGLDSGRDGAVAVSRAALEVRGQYEKASLAIVGHAASADIDNTLERAAQSLEKAMMAARDSTDTGIQLDDVIADLVRDELSVSKHGELVFETVGVTLG